MDKVIRFIKQHAWAGYLGAGTSFISDMGIFNWQWWALIVPVIVLVNLREK